MDLNYLLSRHQISLMLAQSATTTEARHAHRGLATGYADAIQSVRTMLGATGQMVGAH
ncbi:hypothetical protein [uncultured Sphingomonas sp.]|uniref:hypothetical protein n=1 Tax=uncultured Sphingomonas sp. TaxID=158754 RepID=UPI0025FBB10B|nr:hypothetical protein [uncultured Sphingomonas sp.]